MNGWKSLPVSFLANLRNPLNVAQGRMTLAQEECESESITLQQPERLTE